jgi:hypothetical protein
MAAHGNVKQTFTIFFWPWFPVLKSRDFLACFMIEISLSEMVVKLDNDRFAQDYAWSKSFSEMVGKNQRCQTK